MSDGASYRDSELEQATERLRGIQENAAGIIELAAKSDPGFETWGVLGTALFEPWAEAHLDDTYEHLRQMGECLTDHVGAMDANRQFYQVQEQELSEALDQLDDAIDKI